MNMQNEDFTKMIAYAIKAPSGHNTQPWLFKINSDHIDIRPNLSKILPVVDLNNRELFISLGCAAENMSIVASNLGYESILHINSDNTITLTFNKLDHLIPDLLIQQISVRQTNRHIYDGKIIEGMILENAVLAALPMQNNCQIHCWQRGSTWFDILSQYIFRGNELQMKDKRFIHELTSWIRYNKKEAELLQDGLSYDVFGAPNLPLFMAKLAMRLFLNSNKQNQSDKKKIASSSHFILFTTTTNTISDWVLLGRCLQRFLLVTTKAGIVHSYMNPPCEIETLAAQIQDKMPIDHAYPQILLRIGYGKIAAYSRRKEMAHVICSP